MAATVELLEKNKVKITFRVSPEKLEEGIKQAYNKNKGKFNLPGFRKGKAPRKFIEVTFGKEIFFEDAINNVLPEAYEDAVNENDLETVSRPEFDITEISAEDGAVISAEVYLKPEVEVVDYKGVKYNKFETAATEDEINEEIDKTREKNSRIITIEDRPVQLNDTVIIDFEGFIAGEPFDGGKAEGYELVIGSNSFIDTFESQLIGKNIGEECEVNVRFPGDYGQEELQGMPAQFKVKINEIKFKELPDVNDEFAQDVSEFDTLEEYKNDIKAKIEEKKKHQAEHDKEDQVVKAVVEKAIIDLPQVMIDNQVDSMIRDFSQRLESQGINLEAYMQYTGMDQNTLRESYAKNAELQVKARLCLEAVAKAENFDISDEEIEQEIQRIADSYKMEKEKLMAVIHAEEREGIIKDLKTQKSLKFIVENAVEA